MKIEGLHYRTIWSNRKQKSVFIIDQTRLPFAFDIVTIQRWQDMVRSIQTMQVRGAPLIGAAGAYAMALACHELTASAQDISPVALADALQKVAHAVASSRPTAVNLAWAVHRMCGVLADVPVDQWLSKAWDEAERICVEDVEQNQAIAHHGVALIARLAEHKACVNILTHCNAGWLATVDYGTALAPVYQAHDAGMSLHVWVDETRPRNQGARLTAWELSQHGIPHTVISDNAGGYLMQTGQVDMVLVGADRVSRMGDVCNKIGTYLKALAAHHAKIPFYVAVPTPSIDWQIQSALNEMPIELRDAAEVSSISGLDAAGHEVSVRLMPEGSPALNPAFDVTPAAFVTGLITERGVFTPQQLETLCP